MMSRAGPSGGSFDAAALAERVAAAEARVANLERTLALRDETIRELQQAQRMLEERLRAVAPGGSAGAGPAGGAAESSAQPSLGSLTASFRSVIEQFHVPAPGRAPSPTEVVIRSLDLELKGFVGLVAGEPRVDLPAAGRTLDPAALSTIRL